MAGLNLRITSDLIVSKAFYNKYLLLDNVHCEALRGRNTIYAHNKIDLYCRTCR
jgi:hypothetical protein